MAQQHRCWSCMEPLGFNQVKCPHCGFMQASAQEDFALPFGTMLYHDRYLVGKVMGQGGFGITYIGYDQTLERKVAIKEYYPTHIAFRQKSNYLTWHGQTEERHGGVTSFLKEARKMAKLDQYSSIVGVQNFFEENKTAYIVMNFEEGKTFGQLLRERGPCTFQQCVTLLSPIMNDLYYINQKGIIHRDIKPDNIIIHPDGSAVLLDLGAAKEMSPDLGGAVNSTTNLVVSHGFSPMEQYTTSDEIGSWTDVYAMSATIFYAVTGKVPTFAFDRWKEKNESISNQLLSLAPDRITPQQAKVVEKGMAVFAENRIPDMNALYMAARNIKPNPVNPDITKKVLPLGIAAVLALVLGVSFLGKQLFTPKPAIIAQGECGENVVWKLYDDGELNISGTGAMEDYEETETEDDNDAIGITPWKDYAEQITSIHVSDTVSRIGKYAFENLDNLERVTLENGLEEIGGSAFWNCDSLKEIAIPDSVTVIYGYALGHCRALETIKLGKSFKEMGNGVFANNPQLAMIDVSADNPDFSVKDGVLYFQQNILACYPGGLTAEEFVVPDNTTDIAGSAFRGNHHLKKVEIPEGVSSIGEKAFFDCSGLENVLLPESVTEIDDQAFFGCSSLETVNIPAAVTEIKDWTFGKCSALKSITLPENLTAIGKDAFNGCTVLTKVDIPSNVETIGQHAFCYHGSGDLELQFNENLPKFDFIFHNNDTNVKLRLNDEKLQKQYNGYYFGDAGVNSKKMGWNLFDGNTNTKFCAKMDGSVLIWWRADKAFVPQKAILYGAGDDYEFPDRRPKSFVIQGWDGQNEEWVSLVERESSLLTDVSYRSVEYTIETKQAYQWYSIQFTQNLGDEYLQLSEIEIK